MVNLDYRQAGIGSAACGPELPERYKLNESEFSWEVRLTPAFTNDIDPFTLLD